MDVIARGGHLLYKVNGKVVNEAFDAKPDQGKFHRKQNWQSYLYEAMNCYRSARQKRNKQENRTRQCCTGYDKMDVCECTCLKGS